MRNEYSKDIFGRLCIRSREAFVAVLMVFQVVAFVERVCPMNCLGTKQMQEDGEVVDHFNSDKFREIVRSPIESWYLVDRKTRQEVARIVSNRKAEILQSIYSGDDEKVRFGLALACRGQDTPAFQEAAVAVYKDASRSESLRIDAFKAYCMLSPPNVQVLPNRISDLPFLAECSDPECEQMHDENLAGSALVSEMYGNILRASGHNQLEAIHLAQLVRRSDSETEKACALGMLYCIVDNSVGVTEILVDEYQKSGPMKSDLANQLLLTISLSVNDSDFQNVLSRMSLSKQAVTHFSNERARVVRQQDLVNQDIAEYAEQEKVIFVPIFRERLLSGRPSFRMDTLRVLLHAPALADELRKEISALASNGEERTRELAEKLLNAK